MAMCSHAEISIALCTYNGENYLKEQLDSFLQQTLLPYELVVCDDVSSDSTCEILEDFSKRAPFPVRIFRNEYTIGLINNFSKAGSLCQCDYIAFSDQDDIWLPDKLQVSFQRIKAAELEYGKYIPLLVHSDLSLIDTENRIIAPSCMKVKHMMNKEVDPLKTLLVLNYVHGCTLLCNRLLIEESLPFPDIIMNHDGWLALLAASCGKILYIPEAKVLYRQHASNVTGRAQYYFNIKVLIRAARTAFLIRKLTPTWAVITLQRLLHQAKELQRHLSSLSYGIPPYLNTYINALQNGGLINAIKLMFVIKVRQRGFIPNLLDFYIISRKNHIKQNKWGTSVHNDSDF